MANIAESFLVILLAIGMYLILPAIMLWGWPRWVKARQSRSVSSLLSLLGFVLATVSGLLAVSSVAYAHLTGGFPFYDPSLMKIYRWGALLSVAGIVFAAGGVWRPNALRWHALGSAVGMLLFWLLAAMGE